jgi:predicted nucleic acid-binding protein
VRLLDTNIFLRYLTGDDAAKAARCETLLTALPQEREALSLSVLAVAEVVWVLSTRYRFPRSRIVEGLRRLLNTPHIVVAEREALFATFALFEHYPIDFTDAYHAALLYTRDLDAVYSYDTDFDRLPGLKRLEP